jgi:hypothetical protein
MGNCLFSFFQSRDMADEDIAVWIPPITHQGTN